MNKKAITLLFIILVLIASGCTQNPKSNNQQGYSLAFRFQKGTAFFTTTKLTLESNNNVISTKKMKTLTIVKDANQEAARLNIIALSMESEDKNGTRDICPIIPLQKKKETVTVYSDGNVNFGNYSEITFYLPQEKKKIGDKWSFKGVDYKIEKKEHFENTAGSFDCLKISFNGIKHDKLGTKWVQGYFLYDPEKKLKVKEKTIEKRPASQLTLESEITKIEKSYSHETDYSCLYPDKNLAMPQKFMAAVNYFTKGDYLGALQLSKETKKDLEKIKDLNTEEIQIKKNTLSLLALCYERTSEPERALSARFEAAEYYRKFLDSNKIDADDFKQAFENYYRVSKSNNKNKAKAAQELADLNSTLAGWLEGKAILSGTGKKDGFKITVFTGKTQITSEMRGTDEEYSIPVISAKNNLFGVIYTMPGYKPKAITGIKAGPSALSKKYTVILEKSQDQNKGFLAGLCYTPESGKITRFNDQNIEITSGKNTFTASCSKGFYSVQLNPGTYTLQNSKSHEVKAGITTIANIKLPQTK